MNDIVRPITDDGLVGYDEYNQLWAISNDGRYQISRPIADVSKMTCMICNHGWELTAPGMLDQWNWRHHETYVHETCVVRYYGLKDYDLFTTALVQAGVRFDILKPVENGYWRKPDSWAARPWYEADVIGHDARFRVGSRKRVYHIEVQPIEGVLAWSTAAQDAFEKEGVTKHFSAEGVMAHAWSEDKVREYIKAFATLGNLRKESL